MAEIILLVVAAILALLDMIGVDTGNRVRLLSVSVLLVIAALLWGRL